MKTQTLEDGRINRTTKIAGYSVRYKYTGSGHWYSAEIHFNGRWQRLPASISEYVPDAVYIFLDEHEN